MKTIKEWQEYINEWAKSKGWNEKLSDSVECIGTQVTNMHSELSEAWEEIKNGHTPTHVYCSKINSDWATGEKNVYQSDSVDPNFYKPEGFPIELADCVIRILHTCEFYGIDLERMIEVKMKYNETRSYRHGGKKA